MILAVVNKDPQGVTDYTINFDTVLEPDGERLASVAWTAPAGIIIAAGTYGPSISSDGRKATLWLRGGTSGATYEIAAHYVTDHVPAREGDASIMVQVQNA